MLCVIIINKHVTALFDLNPNEQLTVKHERKRIFLVTIATNTMLLIIFN